MDSTGIKFPGDGEWLARKHGTHRRRQYRKVHLAMDTGTGDIRAVEFTSRREGDSPVLPGQLDQIPPDQQIGTVTGDGAFDTRRCHSAILARGAALPSYPSARTVASGRKIAPRQWLAMTFPGRPGALVGRSGSGGRAITSEVGSRRRCAASNSSERGSPRETPTGGPPKSRRAPHRPHEPLQRTRPGRD